MTTCTVNEAHLRIALSEGDARQIVRIAHLAALGFTVTASEELLALAAECVSPEEFQARAEADEIMSRLTRGIIELVYGPQGETLCQGQGI
jgi:hypothetical protein